MKQIITNASTSEYRLKKFIIWSNKDFQSVKLLSSDCIWSIEYALQLNLSFLDATVSILLHTTFIRFRIRILLIGTRALYVDIQFSMLNYWLTRTKMHCDTRKWENVMYGKAAIDYNYFWGRWNIIPYWNGCSTYYTMSSANVECV